MSGYISQIIQNEHFILSAERTVFWEAEKTLLIADLHIGKSGHFRKAGIGIPQSVYKDDLHRLVSQLLFFKAERLIIVGDLSHSKANRELELFQRWRNDFSSLDIHLTKGNHDILEDQWYQESVISVHPHMLQIGKFGFTHEPLESFNDDLYYFAGHVHPAIQVRGRGRQSMRLPCFYFSQQQAILPAFSFFTGSYTVRPYAGEKVVAIANKEMITFEGR